MTDLAALKFQAPPLADASPRIVTMRGFGAGEKPTFAISVGAGVALIGLWSVVAWTGLVPHLFLPTPREVVSAAVSIYEEGYANASLWQHVSASLARILTAAAIAIALGVPVGLLMGLSRWARAYSTRRSNSTGRCRRSPISR